MTEYQFTKDWFKKVPQIWNQLIPQLSGTAGGRNFLEIGSFEGRSTVWIMENMASKGDVILCIDTWEGGEEHGDLDMGSVSERFKINVHSAQNKTGVNVEVCVAKSVTGLAEAITKGRRFDFIYIDGSHTAPDVLTDACMAWPLLKDGGLMVFDDYMWGNPRDALHRPKIAIDAFTNIFGERAEIIHIGYQLAVRKKG